jgi:hypothetical protein
MEYDRSAAERLLGKASRIVQKPELQSAIQTLLHDLSTILKQNGWETSLGHGDNTALRASRGHQKFEISPHTLVVPARNQVGLAIHEPAASQAAPRVISLNYDPVDHILLGSSGRDGLSELAMNLGNLTQE